MQNIKTHEIIDHGPEHAQYFQGCGVAFTKFDHVVTGVGDNAVEALEDALEQIACTEGGIPPATLDRIAAEWRAEHERRDHDIRESCHCGCESSCSNCGVRVVYDVGGGWKHPDDPGTDRWGEPCDDADGDVGHEECERQHYVSVRYTIGPVVVRLDNEHSYAGDVTATCDDPEAADWDQSIDGTYWETPSDMPHEAYTILTDRVGLVEKLRADGYTLDLSAYTAPEHNDMMCDRCAADMTLATAGGYNPDGNGLICRKCACDTCDGAGCAACTPTTQASA